MSESWSGTSASATLRLLPSLKPLPIFADPGLIDQVLMNLVINAATPCRRARSADGLSGWELADRLQSQCPELRVVLTRGYSTNLAGRALLLKQQRSFLQKPAPPAAILALFGARSIRRNRGA
jgi:hypothetical protein